MRKIKKNNGKETKKGKKRTINITGIERVNPFPGASSMEQLLETGRIGQEVVRTLQGK